MTTFATLVLACVLVVTPAAVILAAGWIAYVRITRRFLRGDQ